MKALLSSFVLALLLTLNACKPADQDKRKLVVCTTGYAADLVKQLVAQDAEVIALMGPGVDPHLYKASLRDVALLSEADLIVYSGLHLEGKMAQLFEKLKKTKQIISLSDGLNPSDLLSFGEDGKSHDPHFWFDPLLWKKAGVHFAQHYQKMNWTQVDSLMIRLLAFENQQDSLHQFAKNEFAKIPANKRYLITAHDAFAYFSRAYGLKVRSLQGISTLSEYGLRDVADLVNFLVDNNIPAVFVESSIPKKSLMAVKEGCKQKGFELTIGDELYSDALGENNTPAASYAGVFKHNVRSIVKGLNKLN